MKISDTSSKELTSFRSELSTYVYCTLSEKVISCGSLPAYVSVHTLLPHFGSNNV